MMWRALSALIVLTLLAGESVAASSHNAIRHHPRRALPEKRLNRRKSCVPPSSSLSAASSTTTSSSSSSTHHTTSTTTSQKTTSTAKSSGNSGSSSSGSSSSGGSSSGGSSSGGSITSVKAAAGSTPNGKKAGTSSGDGLSALGDNISWYYDWTPNPASHGGLMAVPMLWGGGTADGTDASRLSAFKKLTQAPQYMIGFEEPDCPSGGGSAGMSVSQGVSDWEQYIAPFKAKGTKLVSPSMCHQVAETWLKQFSEQISTDWDITNVHINKNNMAGVKADLDHYASYGKPLWITEFACVDDSTGFVPCTDQGEIDNFITQIVDLFESDGRVAAYAYSNGEGLGNVWPMTTGSGALSQSGKTYLSAISKY